MDLEKVREFKRKLREFLAKNEIPAGEVADALDISKERVYKYVNEEACANNLPAFLLPDMCIFFGPELLTYLASQAGYGLVPLPEYRGRIGRPMTAARKAMADTNAAIAAFLGLLDGDAMFAHEELQAKIREAVSALLTLTAFPDDILSCGN